MRYAPNPTDVAGHWVGSLLRRALRPTTPPTAERVLRAARATMRRKRYCLVATEGPDRVDARVVQPSRPHPDTLGVDFGTSRRSRKVQAIAATGRATPVYEDDAKSACVVLSGAAIVVDGLAERRRFFPTSFWAFFPEGPEGDDYLLVRFVPRRLELIDFARRIAPEPFGLRAEVLTRTDDGWAREGDAGAPRLGSAVG